MDRGAVGDLDPGAKHDIGLDRDIAAQLGVPAEEHGFRRGQRGAFGHRLLAAEFLPLALGRGEFGAAVDAANFALVAFR